MGEAEGNNLVNICTIYHYRLVGDLNLQTFPVQLGAGPQKLTYFVIISKLAACKRRWLGCRA